MRVYEIIIVNESVREYMRVCESIGACMRGYESVMRVHEIDSDSDSDTHTHTHTHQTC